MINTSVITELRARGITVTRVGMSDQDATAAAIVDLMAAQGPITRAAVATQETVPEAGAFSAVAGTRREPIVWASRSRVVTMSFSSLVMLGVSLLTWGFRPYSMPRSRRMRATWPVALTLYWAWVTTPSGPTTTVERMTPSTTLPYNFFSP